MEAIKAEIYVGFQVPTRHDIGSFLKAFPSLWQLVCGAILELSIMSRLVCFGRCHLFCYTEKKWGHVDLFFTHFESLTDHIRKNIGQ